jgi:hypothetical protein
MTFWYVNMNTTGGQRQRHATDRGGGTIDVAGCMVNTAGTNSVGIYLTGAIKVTGGTFTDAGAEVAVIEGENEITLNDISLLTSFNNKWGMMIYQSMSGDAEGAQGEFSMTGGSLADTAANRPLFYVTNSTGIIRLKNVQLLAVSGVLVQVEAGISGMSITHITGNGFTVDYDASNPANSVSSG